MNTKLSLSKSIEISAEPAAVWDVLTNPEKIKIFLFGTETITDWKVGSPIIFQGEYQGMQYKDKGNVLENKPNELLKYNYWSGFSGTEDTLENYAIVCYEIEALATGKVKFTWSQTGFSSEDGMKHTEQGMTSMLEQIRDLSEGKS